MQGQIAFRLFVKVGGASAGTPIQSITATVKTQDQAMIVAGLANGSTVVVHVALSNRSVRHCPFGPVGACHVPSLTFVSCTQQLSPYVPYMHKTFMLDAHGSPGMSDVRFQLYFKLNMKIVKLNSLCLPSSYPPPEAVLNTKVPYSILSIAGFLGAKTSTFPDCYD